MKLNLEKKKICEKVWTFNYLKENVSVYLSLYIVKIPE